EPGDNGLLEVHEVLPRPDLAPVRVPRELESNAVPVRLERGARLMREEHELAACVTPLNGPRDVAPAAEPVRGGIVDPGEIEPRIAPDAHVLVAEHAHPEPCELAAPRLRAGVELVVPGNEVDAVTALEIRERRDGVPELAHGAVY